MGPIRTLPTFATFGEMLHYLRRSAQLTQQELARTVGYSESMISRLEHDERPPDIATIQALFVPALHLEKSSEVVETFVALARAERSEKDRHQQSKAASPAPFGARHHIPARLTSFVGRVDDVQAVAQLLAQTRLVTLTGPGGCGKTSLGVETCRWLAGARPLVVDMGETDVPAFDDICVVELFSLNDPSLLVQTVVAALGFEAIPERTALQTLVDIVGDRCVLLMLDNCEHLVDAVAGFAQVALASCPNLYVLVTSRERLDITAETIYPVASLACPEPQLLLPFADMVEFPAIQLFVERSQAISPGFVLTPENVNFVARICTLLDGMPLALELGAAATATFSVADIAERLGTHLLQASLGRRSADPRHASIGDAVAWSYNLLPPAEQQLLKKLAVFAGGWTLDAMNQVCTNGQDHAHILHQLVHKSLVLVDYSQEPEGRTRYHLLRAVCEYATERLQETSGANNLRQRHFNFFAQLGITLGDQVLGPQHREAMQALDADHANIRAALAFARGQARLAERYAHLAAALTFYWRLRGFVGESTAWLQAVSAHDCRLSLATRAWAYIAVLSELSCRHDWFNQSVRGDLELPCRVAEADALMTACLEQNDLQTAALLMLVIADLEGNQGVVVHAEEYARRAWELLERAGDVRGSALACIELGRILFAKGEITAAERVHVDTVGFLEQNHLSWKLCESYRLHATIAQLRHDRAGTVRDLLRMAEIAEQEECPQILHDAYYYLEFLDRALACRLAEEYLDRQRQRKLSVMLGLALHQLGRMYLNVQQYEQAQSYLDEALQLWPRLGLKSREVLGSQWSLIDRGETAWFLGDADLALFCFGESIRLFTVSPYPFFGMYPLLLRGYARCAMDQIEGALEDFRRCLLLEDQAPEGWRHIVIHCMAGIGEVARRRGDGDTAAKLFAASAALESRWHALAQDGQPHEMAHYDSIMTAMSQYRQDPEFEAAWQEGQELAPDEAVQLALRW